MRWLPFRARSPHGRPPVGFLIAHTHTVWRVVNVQDVDIALSEDDTKAWVEAGMPDPATWWARPYRVDVDYVGGVQIPHPEEPGEIMRAGSWTIPATRYWAWDVYPTERWPACSCCGEPMPCRAEVRDDAVKAAAEQLDKLAAKLPGACWACAEPFTPRQKSVPYPGENLDLPGGPPVRFHTRASCWHRATLYELRWIAQDPRRERILTWPKCEGMLVIHHDGSSECRPWSARRYGSGDPQPDCRGHLTHDHGHHTACFRADDDPCPRGCVQEGHPGTRPSPRPERRDQLTLGGPS